MKTLKIMPLLTGVMIAAAIAVTPLAAKAQAQQSQSRPPEIVLTAEQQSTIKKIRAQTLDEIKKVLSPTQMAQFQKDGPAGLKDLSDPQKKRLQEIFESYIKSIRSTLTQQQLQQLEQARPRQ
jgi:hypothetical protein